MKLNRKLHACSERSSRWSWKHSTRFCSSRHNLLIQHKFELIVCNNCCNVWLMITFPTALHCMLKSIGEFESANRHIGRQEITWLLQNVVKVKLLLCAKRNEMKKNERTSEELDFMQNVSVHLCIISCIKHLSFSVFNLLLSVNHVACPTTARCLVTAL